MQSPFTTRITDYFSLQSDKQKIVRWVSVLLQLPPFDDIPRGYLILKEDGARYLLSSAPLQSDYRRNDSNSLTVLNFKNSHDPLNYSNIITVPLSLEVVCMQKLNADSSVAARITSP